MNIRMGTNLFFFLFIILNSFVKENTGGFVTASLTPTLGRCVGVYFDIRRATSAVFSCFHSPGFIPSNERAPIFTRINLSVG